MATAPFVKHIVTISFTYNPLSVQINISKDYINDTIK